MHQLLRIDRMLIHNLHGIVSNLLVPLSHVEAATALGLVFELVGVRRDSLPSSMTKLPLRILSVR